ncbi:MAG: HEAT repeat domain-containing protein [Bacillus sp. (in: firmicutes)]
MQNLELFFLSILTLSIFGMLFILLGYLTIRKTVDIKRRERINSYKEQFNPLLFSMLTEGRYSRVLTTETILQQKAIEELLSRYTSILEGEEEKTRLTELASLYLTPYYQIQLKSKRWSTRMNTLYHIEDFHMSHLLEDVSRLLYRRRISREELVHVLRILAKFNYQEMFELLTNEYDHLSEYDYRNILIRMEPNHFDQFILHFHKSNISLKKAVLDIISLKRDITYLSFLEKMFESYKGEIRLRSMKALAEIGYVENIEPYLELLYSEKWEERMVAAKLIGSLKEERGIHRLIELLHDSSWWVRSQAGQAIDQFTNGKEIFRSVLETSNDAFAKDMAWEWLHKGV